MDSSLLQLLGVLCIQVFSGSVSRDEHMFMAKVLIPEGKALKVYMAPQANLVYPEFHLPCMTVSG